MTEVSPKVKVSTRRLAEATAQGAASISRHLRQLATLGVVTIDGPTQADPGRNDGKTIVEIQFAVNGSRNTLPNSDPLTENWFLRQSLADDAFGRGCGYSQAISRRTMPTVLLRNAGPAARLLWAALLDNAGNVGELVDRTGLKLSSVRSGLSRLATLGLVNGIGVA